MAPARTLPGSRKIAIAAAAFSFLAAVGAATDTGLLSQCLSAPPPDLKTNIYLELDYLAGTNAIQRRTTPECTMERGMWPLGISLVVSPSEESFPPGDPYTCLTQAEADSLVCGTLSWDSDWSAHGVVVKSKAVLELNAAGDDLICPADRRGVIWLLPPCGSTESASSKTWISGFRKHFLAFWKPDKGDPVGRDNKAFITNMHELGHVLNLHHCELDADNLDNNGIYKSTGNCMNHLGHKTRFENHVMPGSAKNPGLPFCDANKTHWRMHGSRSCCGKDLVEEPESGPLAEDLKTLRKDVRLVVVPEKRPYFPGEPIHVNFSLERARAGADLSAYSIYPDSLNPDTGHLFISAKSKVLFAKYRTLRSAFLHETEASAAAPLTRAVRKRDGVGIWFTLSDSDHRPRRRSFWLQAQFAGFSNKALHLESAPVEIDVGTTNSSPGLFDEDAYDLFMHPAARQFLFLLGGDHLRLGFETLSRISRDFSQTIYSPYADIALGVHWAWPFNGFDADGAIITRAADKTKAMEHLLKAKAWNDAHQGNTKLPPSWKGLLDNTLMRVQMLP